MNAEPPKVPAGTAWAPPEPRIDNTRAYLRHLKSMKNAPAEEIERVEQELRDLEGWELPPGG